MKSGCRAIGILTNLSWEFHSNGKSIYLCYQIELTAIDAVPDGLKEREFDIYIKYVAKDSNGVIVKKDDFGSYNMKIGEKTKGKISLHEDARFVEIEYFGWKY